MYYTVYTYIYIYITFSVKVSQALRKGKSAAQILKNLWATRWGQRRPFLVTRAPGLGEARERPRDCVRRAALGICEACGRD